MSLAVLATRSGAGKESSAAASSARGRPDRGHVGKRLSVAVAARSLFLALLVSHRSLQLAMSNQYGQGSKYTQWDFVKGHLTARVPVPEANLEGRVALITGATSGLVPLFYSDSCGEHSSRVAELQGRRMPS